MAERTSNYKPSTYIAPYPWAFTGWITRRTTSSTSESLTVIRAACTQTRFFFFSSRRRHTRFDCDWSSDVCSSDLRGRPNGRPRVSRRSVRPRVHGKRHLGVWSCAPTRARVLSMGHGPGELGGGRSEEREVGKECRSRGSRYH